MVFSDYDGGQNTFIVGGVKHNKYPLTDKSYFFENENGDFKDVTGSRIYQIRK